MTTALLQELTRALMLGISLSSFLLALMLIAMLGRYSKDVNEVIATWEYVRTMLIVGVLSLAGFMVSLRQQRSTMMNEH